ncbi:MAG: DNA helicase RecQ [Gammaproteobacteria bacterium]
MSGRPFEILQNVFGYDRFRGQQQAVIEELLADRDALVLMPTGGGKSLCYQIPAIIKPGVGIVVSPLIALMQDQVGALHQLGVRAAYLNSTLTLDAVREIERRLLDGQLDLLYVAPERLLTERTLGLLDRLQLALFAIDEAHCVSQWGHDFRADYLQLSILHRRYPAVPRIALTATADDKTREEIVTRLALDRARIFVAGFDRPNIRYRIVQKQNARRQLLDFIRTEHAGDAGIVYCLSRKKVEATASWLQSQGIRALPYHAGMDAESRHKHQHRFLMEEGLIIVATIAFGMGIDKPNVRFVAHLDLPKSVEAYYQETGRAGRDGLPADAWMAYGLQDVIALQQLLAASNADENRKRLEYHKLDAMLALCEQVGCRRQALLSYFGDFLEHGCGNCDNCLEPVSTWDGTVAAQQALSCIYRTGQRFGVHYLIDVLLGRDNERIKQFGHDRQSTFGIGKDVDEKQWRSVFRQLVARGLAAVDLEGYGGLRLTDACRPILRGEQTLMLRKDLAAATGKRQKSTFGEFDNEQDALLWQALRAKRRELADAQNIPPYLIFSDATLMDMVEFRPHDHRQFRRISGVGERKLDLYGDEFLAVIAEFPATLDNSKATASPLSATVEDTLSLFRIGYDPERIATQRGITVDTVYSHMAQALEQGAVELNDIVDLPASEINDIQDSILNLPEVQKMALKPVFDLYRGRYGYGVLRCIRAALYRGAN